MSIYRPKPHYTPKPSLLQRVGTFFCLLLMLAGLCSAIFLFFFRGYVVDTPDGPRLELPFFAQEMASAPVSSSNVSVTIPDETEATLLEPLHAIRLPVETILDQTVHTEMQNAGCNAVIFDMRTEDGLLHYVSDLTLAIDSGASAAVPGLNDAIRALNKTSDIYSIARVSCFPDLRLTETEPEFALHRASGAVWRDFANTAWLSPSCDEVQSYLLGICQELSDLGFDEILLTNSAYPTKGSAFLQDGTLNDSKSVLSITLEDFYQEMRTALEELGVRLSIFLEPSSQGEQEQSGQTLDAVLFAADRVWLEGTYDDAIQVFSSRGLSFSNLSLVCILNKSGENSYSWAIL